MKALGSDTLEKEISFDDLPDEVIEFVLSFVSPYKDLHDCMLVCKRWRLSVLNVVQLKRRNLRKALKECNVKWQVLQSSDRSPTIAKRYSHTAVVHDNSMYVFGGCTNSMTTFNDLWRFDLSQREWIRMLTTGFYPTPKACSSMVCYKDQLVLFGGWAYPSLYPFHQSYQLFNELHFYDIASNKWNYVVSNSPPPMAGHSASVHKDTMVVFGGMQLSHSTGNSVKINEVWTLNLQDSTWQKQETSIEKPAERYGHSHTYIDEENLLIMGGCGGPNGLYNDAWLLNMSSTVWNWKQVTVKNKEWAPPEAWCHPTCRVNDCIVLLNRPKFVDMIKSCRRPPERRPLLQPQPTDNASKAKQETRPSTSKSPLHTKTIHQNSDGMMLSLSAFAEPSRNPISRNREKQLAMLRKMENLIKNRNKTQEPPKKPKNVLCLYVLDISNVLNSEPVVSWMRPKLTSQSGPEETLLYTLVKGKAELIMFGGIQKDDSSFKVLSTDFDPSTYPTKVSNCLHFITAPTDII